MLPSYNLFRSVDCPFDLAGLCYRPYCHYRHLKKADRIRLREKEKRWNREERERQRRRSQEMLVREAKKEKRELPTVDETSEPPVKKVNPPVNASKIPVRSSPTTTNVTNDPDNGSSSPTKRPRTPTKEPAKHGNSSSSKSFHSHHKASKHHKTSKQSSKQERDQQRDKTDGRVHEKPNNTPVIPNVPESSRKHFGREPMSSSKRIAPATGVTTLLKAKESFMTNTNSKTSQSLPSKSLLRNASDDQDNGSNVAQSPTGKPKRIAHTPQSQKSDAGRTTTRPLISFESARKHSKIPGTIRQLALDQFVEECLKICQDQTAAFERAIQLELDIVGRCHSRAVYSVSCTNAKIRLRKEGINGQAPASGFNQTEGQLIYAELSKLLINREILRYNGFPLPGPEGSPSGYAIFENNLRPKKPRPPNMSKDSRMCDRCSKIYRIDKDGFPLIMEECIYHHGKAFQKKVRGLVELRFNCCDGEPNSPGCVDAPTHVSTNTLRSDNLGFASAIMPIGENMGSDEWDVIGVDCEMVYTTQGIEVARVTVVGINSKVLLDELVKTFFPILDYNTRFSGLTEKIHKEAKYDLRQIQGCFLSHLKPNSIIVGHSLESDLLVLKLIHTTVVDTSILYPHKQGPPLKRALRSLSHEYLGKIIQSGVDGHDSAEDARTSLQLALYKIGRQFLK